MPLPRTAILLFSMALLTFASQAQDTLRFPEGELEAALKQARRSKRPLMIDFHADWCLPCKQMEITTFRDSGLVARFNREFVLHGVDVDLFIGMDVAEAYGVEKYPTILILDRKGRELARAVGYHNARELISIADGLPKGKRRRK